MEKTHAIIRAYMLIIILLDSACATGAQMVDADFAKECDVFCDIDGLISGKPTYSNVSPYVTGMMEEKQFKHYDRVLQNGDQYSISIEVARIIAMKCKKSAHCILRFPGCEYNDADVFDPIDGTEINALPDESAKKFMLAVLEYQRLIAAEFPHSLNLYLDLKQKAPLKSAKVGGILKFDFGTYLAIRTDNGEKWLLNLNYIVAYDWIETREEWQTSKVELRKLPVRPPNPFPTVVNVETGQPKHLSGELELLQAYDVYCDLAGIAARTPAYSDVAVRGRTIVGGKNFANFDESLHDGGHRRVSVDATKIVAMQAAVNAPRYNVTLDGHTELFDLYTKQPQQSIPAAPLEGKEKFMYAMFVHQCSVSGTFPGGGNFFLDDRRNAKFESMTVMFRLKTEIGTYLGMKDDKEHKWLLNPSYIFAYDSVETKEQRDREDAEFRRLHPELDGIR